MAQERLLSREEFRDLLPTIRSKPKYDSAVESRIPHPLWDLDRSQVQALLREISRIVKSATEGGRVLDTELKHITIECDKLERPRQARSIKVAILGAQGAGKSLLINAIFDVDIGLTGSKGQACTSAIIRYAYGSGDNFTAEIKFFDAKMRGQIIEEHIRSYSNYCNDLVDSEDEDGTQIKSSGDDDMDRTRKETAEDFFDVIFGSRDEFLAAWDYIADDREFKSYCETKCLELMARYEGDGQTCATFVRSSPLELLKVIEPFVSNVDTGICLWPLVDYVTIRFQHPLLQNCEIIDMSGTGDTNLARARHADEVKDNVDVEIILGDTDRLGTNEMVVSAARAAILNHGARNVKVIATKIDVTNEQDFIHCSGDFYEEINSKISQAAEDAALAEEEGEDAEVTFINRYKTYLQRYRSAAAIRERALRISAILSAKLGSTLQGSSQEYKIEVFHTSAADYMTWIKSNPTPSKKMQPKRPPSNKVLFDQQPALDPEGTGIPAIRRLLFNIPASQNLHDLIHHIDVTVPAFFEKLNRIVTQSDRDVGFCTIANDFDGQRIKFLEELFKLAQVHHTKFSRQSIKRIKNNSDPFKRQINDLVQSWVELPWQTFNRVLKGKGIVMQVASNAKGSEVTANWNLQLATIMKPGFSDWHDAYVKDLKIFGHAMIRNVGRIHAELMKIISNSPANLMTVEKAKHKWTSIRHGMEYKMELMMEELLHEEKRFWNRVTLKDDSKNNIIASITDPIYDDVWSATPAPMNGQPGKKKKYRVPIVKFRKDNLEKHFTDPNSHFVDKLIVHFRKQLEDKMLEVIYKYLTEVIETLDKFSNWLRAHAPVDYTIDDDGIAIRANLEKQIPRIEEILSELRSLLPGPIKEEHEISAGTEEDYDEPGNQIQNLTYFIERVSKEKKRSLESSTNPAKKAKREHV